MAASDGLAAILRDARARARAPQDEGRDRFTGAAVSWLIGALLIFAVVPFTLLVIMPTNKKLLDPAIDRSSPTVHRLLEHWGRLHAVRSVLALASTIVFLASLVSSKQKP